MIEFSVVFVALVLPLAYVIVTMSAVQLAMLGTSAAAREAGRVYATADSAADARARSDVAAQAVLVNHGLTEPGRGAVQATSSCPSATEGCVNGFGRGAEVEVTVVYQVPVAGPIQGLVGLEIPVSSTHRTRVDRFRGLA